MPDAFAMNKKRLQANKRSMDYKSRKGGISKDAWNDLSKKEKKEAQGKGIYSPYATTFAANPQEVKKFQEKEDLWGEAAYEHGYGNVKSGDDLRGLMKAHDETGIKNMDSYNDVRQFRRAHNDFDSKRFDAIEDRLDGMGNTTSKPETEEPKEKTPVTDSQHLARAKAYVSAKDETDLKGETTAQKTGFNPVTGAAGFGSSFMHRYADNVKKNLEPKPSVSGKLANDAKSDVNKAGNDPNKMYML